VQGWIRLRQGIFMVKYIHNKNFIMMMGWHKPHIYIYTCIHTIFWPRHICAGEYHKIVSLPHVDYVHSWNLDKYPWWSWRVFHGFAHLVCQTPLVRWRDIFSAWHHLMNGNHLETQRPLVAASVTAVSGLFRTIW
jgi:hypothetical protein